MCGIAGYVTLTPADIPEQVLRRMTEILRHRGPDASGYHRDALASLGHRRLSIVDLAAGQQPMYNENHRVCIIFNGEIFNHASVRSELEREGCRYATRSDTETILHAYERDGAECVKRLRGMFAFAIWDSDKQTLYCARDRMGIKPFYYYWDGQIFVFASEIKALFQHPAVSPALDESQLAEYLAFGYTSGDRTLFAGVRRLMPGHRLTLSVNGLEISQYWEIPEPHPDDRDDTEWIRECRRRLEDAVETRLMSDVPLGVFLSGGVDSSAIAALMTRMTGQPVTSFSVGYGEQAFSELEFARRTAAAIGSRHREVVVARDDFFAALPRLIWHEDEPIAWPSSVPLYFVAKLAAEDIKVVLTGEGADELFGGYARYAYYLANRDRMRMYARLPEAPRRALRRWVADTPLLTASVRRKVQHTILARQPGLESFYLDNFYCAFSGDELRQIYPRLAPTAYDTYLGFWRGGQNRSPLGQLLYADQKTYLVELLMKQDQMSMAASIESRVPFLDHIFVEFSASVPDRLKVRRGTGKYILREAVKDILPQETLVRPKMGFPTPLVAWLSDARAAALYDRLRNRDGLLASCTDRAALNRLLDDHAQRRVDATDRIWRLLNLEIWGDTFITGRAHNAPHAFDENLVGQV
jgi:asparagine synthase (glutamine-hydrolysing)